MSSLELKERVSNCLLDILTRHPVGVHYKLYLNVQRTWNQRSCESRAIEFIFLLSVEIPNTTIVEKSNAYIGTRQVMRKIDAIQ